MHPSASKEKEMSHRSIFHVISTILFAFGTLSAMQGQGPQFVNQGWTSQERQTFYTTTQGSQMMPMDWFMALEQSNGDPFTKDLTRYGFLPSSVNPNGLPVGFTLDSQAGKWAGLTCAACHTNQIEYNGKMWQLDGGPTDADLFTFVAQLGEAIQGTLADPARFGRFATKVGATTPAAQQALRNELTRFSAYFSTFLNAATPPTPWGPARADAQGLIFNRVSAIDLSDLAVWQWFHAMEKNNRTPNAPVSYPYLWGVSRLDWVQWNGIAANNSCLARLGRNVGEALGAFARVQLTPSSLGYSATVLAGNQVMLEETLIKKLKSPLWSDTNLPPIDSAKKAAGEALYKTHCINCHAAIDRNSGSPVKVNLTPLAQIGTDPLMATNVACRTADTAVLAGTRQPALDLKIPKLTKNDYVVNLAQNEVAGIIVSNALNLPFSCYFKVLPKATATEKTAPSKKALVQKMPPVYRAAKATGECVTKLEQYIGRPLDGIWASPPYLHNGSVPSLYQLLLPASQRVATFKVGSRTFDPANVGFDINSGSFTFDTTIPGNGNQGHEYGGTLTETQRQQLLEYLKSL
jgi:mono/diheme cytochrome c family protein